MNKNISINNFISFLPMPAVLIDDKGYVISANNLYNQRFKFDRISNKNKVLLQTFLNFDVANVLKRLFSGNNSISTYDYKFNDLDENQITVDLHFSAVEKKLALLIIQEKDNFKTHMTQTSKILGEVFINGFSNSLYRNVTTPITKILGSVELYKKLNKQEVFDKQKLIEIINEESNAIKNYLNKISNTYESNSYSEDKTNIHVCLNEAIDKVSKKLYSKIRIITNYDPSIPEIYFNKQQLVECLCNILSNSIENDKDSKISISSKINHDMYVRSEDLQKVLKLPVHIKILDYGSGVDEKIEQFMFYPFVTNKIDADGLGLTYTNIIISKNGGYLKYEKEKEGTAFNIFLPLNNSGRH